jgi:hypothetical protein
LFYKSLKEHFDGEVVNLHDWEIRSKLRLYIPSGAIVEAMEFSPDELNNASSIIQSSIWGLSRENLVSNFSNGEAAFNVIEYQDKELIKNGIIFEATIPGIELIMWAYGYGQKNAIEIFSPKIVFSNLNDISVGLTRRLD